MQRVVCLPTIMDKIGPLISATPGPFCSDPTFMDETGTLISGSMVGQTAVVRADKSYQPGCEGSEINAR